MVWFRNILKYRFKIKFHGTCNIRWPVIHVTCLSSVHISVTDTKCDSYPEFLSHPLHKRCLPVFMAALLSVIIIGVVLIKIPGIPIVLCRERGKKIYYLKNTPEIAGRDLFSRRCFPLGWVMRFFYCFMNTGFDKNQFISLVLEISALEASHNGFFPQRKL